MVIFLIAAIIGLLPVFCYQGRISSIHDDCGKGLLLPDCLDPADLAVGKPDFYPVMVSSGTCQDMHDYPISQLAGFLVGLGHY
jgi:hypothetical protein